MALNTRNFGTLISETQRIVQDTQSTTLRAAIKDAINRALDAASSLYEWPSLIEVDESGYRQPSDTTTALLLSGDSFFPAPYQTGRLRAVQIQNTNAPSLKIVTVDELFDRMGVASQTTAGQPMYAAQVGMTAQIRPLAEDGFLTVRAASASNDNTKTVRIYFQKATGLMGNRHWVDVSGVFSGGVLAVSARAEAGYPIKSVSIPAGWVGGLTIEDANGVILVDMQAVEVSTTASNDLPIVMQRALIKVFPTPDTDYLGTVMWWRVPLMLTEDEDVPELPIGSFLVAKAAADIFGQQGKLNESQLWERRALGALRSTIQQNTGHKRVVTKPLRGSVTAQNSYDWR